MRPSLQRAVLLLVFASSAAHSQSRRTDADALQGAWRLIDARARMSNEPAMIIDGLVGRGTVTFAGGQVTMRELGHSDLASYAFTLDTAGAPRRITLVEVSAPDSSRWIGIYRINGDTLRLSVPIDYDGRRPIPPTSFNGPNTAAYTFKRDSTSTP